MKIHYGTVPRSAIGCIALQLLTTSFHAYGQMGNYSSHAVSGRSVVITGSSGEKIRITPYGDHMMRIQAAREEEDFYPDDRYEMVVRHDWEGKCAVDSGDASALTVSTGVPDGISVTVTKNPLRLAFALKNGDGPLLRESEGVSWNGNSVTESFVATADEHFAGLGHEAYGRIEKLDRRGTSLKVTRGSEGACVVPFYVSSKGYGLFLNTTFTHTITLCKNEVYSLSIDGEGYGGRMDYFFIAGPSLTRVIDLYTQLTGRPRLPQKSIFGLHLSDKSDPDNNGEQWWKKMITDHRNAGYAIDHQVNDNAWRASNAATSGQKNSWFEFRRDRFPDPAAYKRWCDANGVTVTLDLNRPGIPLNQSWKSEYSIPGTNDCPDFTNPAARKWIWQLFFTKAFDPSLGYPGDAVWLDEFDYPDHDHSTTLSNGKRWAEESINYHFDLLKACVEEGWDSAMGEAKRPYFWSRGITAGAQRFGSHWSGDIDGNYTDMKYQVKAMQSAGISGFPFFNHDAGGHVNLTSNSDNSYRQWDMGFGSFTPVWKPHGPSHKRWPQQRSSVCQVTAGTHITTRYRMIPYIYSYAYQAHVTGIPMARPMFLEDKDNETAWQKELQYYWGRELIVAPNCSDGNNTVPVWLPKGNWYDFRNDAKFAGDRTVDYSAATGVVPVFVKEGAVIPMAQFAKSTFFIPKDTLFIHVYTGANGTFRLYEDDGVTEKFRTANEFRLTDIRFTGENLRLEVGSSSGTFSGAPSRRSCRIVYHGLTDKSALYHDTTPVQSYAEESAVPSNGSGTVWDSEKKLQTVYLPSLPVDRAFTVSAIPTAARIGPGGIMTGGGGGVRVSGGRIVLDGSFAGAKSISIHRLDGRMIRSYPRSFGPDGSGGKLYLNLPRMSRGTCLLLIETENSGFARHIVLQ